MKKLLFLIMIFVSSNIIAQTNNDAIYSGKCNSLITRHYKEKTPVSFSRNEYFKMSGELLQKSALIQGVSLSFFALSGASSYWVSTQKDKVWALPILFGGTGLILQIYSINLKSKSGKMLILAAESDGLKAKIKF